MTRKLREYETKYQEVFPPNWNVAEKICEYFGNRTSEQFTKILERAVPDVKILLHAIRETLKWEKEMSILFAKMPSTTALPTAPESPRGGPETAQKDGEGDDEDENNPHSAAAIAKRYRKFQEEKKQQQQVAGPQPDPKYLGMISSTFNPYMDIYIKEEDALMRQKFEAIMAEETWEVDDDARNKVLRSSTDLIFYFKKSMKR
jgi:vacuolar protein sorting-associated protein 53